MKKVMLLSDSPYATTGLGRMSKYFLRMLPDFEWTVWGFLHPDFNMRSGRMYPYWNPSDFPDTKFKVLSPKMFIDEQYGLDLALQFIPTEKPDFLITSMDFHLIAPYAEHIKKLQMVHGFKWIAYIPMDREDFKELELPLLTMPDELVVITKFGQDKIKSFNSKFPVKQIYHPIDETEFPELDAKKLKKTRSKLWQGVEKDTFVVGTVNRSFARKDTARLVVALSRFLKDTTKTYAYIHGSPKTIEGMDLRDLAYQNGLPQHRLAFLPEDVTETMALPQSALNTIYRSLDVFVTASVGEGFGYTTVEAMLTETPIVAPANTSFPELVQDFGYLIEPYAEAFNLPRSTTLWPIVKIDDIVSKLKYVQSHRPEAKAKAKEGARWVRENLNLDTIADQWREILK